LFSKKIHFEEGNLNLLKTHGTNRIKADLAVFTFWADEKYWLHAQGHPVYYWNRVADRAKKVNADAIGNTWSDWVWRWIPVLKVNASLGVVPIKYIMADVLWGIHVEMEIQSDLREINKILNVWSRWKVELDNTHFRLVGLRNSAHSCVEEFWIFKIIVWIGGSDVGSFVFLG